MLGWLKSKFGEEHVCGECGKPLNTERGLAIHKGKLH